MPDVSASGRSAVVLGVDPGLRVTGWATLMCSGALPSAAVTHGVLIPPPKGPLPQRLRAIQQGLAEVIATHNPAVVAVERPFMRENVRSAMALAQAQAAVLLAAADAGLPVSEYAPREVKQAISGDGNAEKAALAQALALQLGLAEPPTPTDAADALAVALCHWFVAGTTARVAESRVR